MSLFMDVQSIWMELITWIPASFCALACNSVYCKASAQNSASLQLVSANPFMNRSLSSCLCKSKNINHISCYILLLLLLL